MKIKGIEAQPHQLSYDKIVKNTLAQSDQMTVRFINGLLGEDIPLDASVTWLDKESVNDKHTAFVADFYPKVAGRMYSVEIEQDDNGDMAVRVFKYTVGGAILHSMDATDESINITFPQPCVIFLKSGKSTPQKLTWNIEFFDGQKVSLDVPVIRLGALSVKEIAERDLLPVGQFYLRTFEPLTKKDGEKLQEAAAELLSELKNAIERKSIPYHIGVQMQETIRKTLENIFIRAGKEVDAAMTTNIVETLPWIDYKEVFEKLEARGKAEGIAEGKAEGKAEGIAEGKAEGIAEGKAKGMAEGITKGKAERDMEIALKMFDRQKTGMSLSVITEMMKEIGISSEVMEAAYRKHEAESR